jgi:hypothetical protein
MASRFGKLAHPSLLPLWMNADAFKNIVTNQKYLTELPVI